MKTTWNKALAAVVVLGCVMSWSFAQPPANVPLSPVPQDPGRTPGAGPPGATPAPPGYPVQPPAAGNEDVQTVIEVTPDGRRVMRTVHTGRYGGAWYAAPVVSDPETAKLYAAEEEAAKEAHTIVTKLRSLTDEKGDVEDIKKLREALTKQFDAQQKRRAHEINKIEERLGKLKDTMKKRESAKDTIIGRRLDELSGVTDDLGWEETGVPARVRSIEPNYGLPGVAPVPASPRAYPGAAGEVPTTPRVLGGGTEPRR